MVDMVADAYVTMATFRTFLRVTATTDATDPDSALELLALEAAARAIDRACGRTFAAELTVAAARYFTPFRIVPDSLYHRTVLPIDDVFDLTGMTVYFDVTGNGSFTGTAITAYRAGPLNAAARGMPYTKLAFDTGTYPPLHADSVKVTALWGWDEIPTTIQNANLIQAARFMKRRDAPFGIAGSPEMGNEIRLLAKLDPDVALMVGAYKRNWGVA